jgi:hypothetical protein
MSYSFVLYLHIASAMMLMGSTGASRIAEQGLRAAPDLATLRGALDVVRRATRLNPVFAIVMLLSGAVLGRTGSWTEPWFWVAVATWFANLVLAVRFVGPGHQALGMAAAQAGDGPVPSPVDALRRARAPALALDVMIGLDLATLLLMVVRPAIDTALVWPALGVALSCAIRFATERPRNVRSASAPAGR